MSAQSLQQLNFMVSLIDRVSGPTGKIMKSMDTMTTQVQAGYQKIGYGMAGLMGTGYMLDRITGPARELDNALREVKSLSVADDVLTDLTKTSMQFSTTYGESASQFVKSSYDIQSAISGLVGNELGQFTEASNILAKGTKSDAGTITSYVGTMYGIFQKNANAMGKGEWVQMLAGQTAAAVEMFKTTGTEMSAAFTSVGAQATSHGIQMNEQIAILGRLQATMSGSEAGTKYRAFLNNVGRAQEELGLQFTDSHGRMLPMVDILSKIQGKFGDLDTVAGSDMLKKAFGTDEAVSLINLMMQDVDGLAMSIDKIGEQKGMTKAMEMAEAMTDPFAVAGKQIQAIQIALGKALIPTLLPFLDTMGQGAQTLLRWTNLFPNLTGLIGKGMLSVLGLIAAISALSIAVGISKFLMVGFNVVWAITKGLFIATKIALIPFGPLLAGVRAAWLAMNLSVAAGNGLMASSRAGMVAMWGTMKFLVLQSKLVTGAIWMFNGGLKAMTITLFANPITWLVLGVTALIAALVAAVVYWDVWTAKLVEWGGQFLEFIGLFSLVDGVLAAWQKLPEWWTGFKNWLGTLDPFSFLGDSLDWVLGKLKWIPGMDKLGDGPAMPEPIKAPPSLTGGNQPSSQGGVLNRISNATSNNQRNVGDVHVHNYGDEMNGQRLADELALSVG